MATINANPFADCKVPAAGSAIMASSKRSGIVVGLCPYTEGGTRFSSSSGASTQRGRHVAIVTDYSGTSGGTNDGRWLSLWTQGDSDLTSDQLNVDTKLTGTVGGDLPDFAVMQGFLGFVDGKGRSAAGDDVVGGIQSITEENITDVALTWGYLDITANVTAVNGGIRQYGTGFGQTQNVARFSALGTPAVNDAFLIGYTQRFNQIEMTFSTAGVGTYTVTWEYWDGSAWQALSGVTDSTSSWTATGTVTWTMPGGMAWRAGGKAGDTTTTLPQLYWIRGRISAFTSMATRPIASAITIEEAAVFGGTAVFDNNRATTSYYLGHRSTFSAVDLLVTTVGVYATGSFAWQYWNGTAWTALSGVTDNSTNLTLSGLRRVSFTVPGDWALADLHEASASGSNDGSGRCYWIRLHATTYSETTQPVVTVQQATAVSAPSISPACLAIGDDVLNVTPSVIQWGLALPAGIVASATGLYTFWDPVRRIRSRRFDFPSNSPNGLTHGQSNVVIAKWSGTGTTATLAATIAQGSNAENTGAADTTITIGKDAGPPIPTDETLPSDRRTTATGFTTCCVHRDRVFCAGARGYDTTLTGRRVGKGNQVLWSEANDFHHFPRANTVEVAANDGDEIVCIRSFRDHLVIFKRTKTYLLVGEPGTGAAGIQIVQVSDNIGCVAKRTAISNGNHLYWLSERGVMRMDGAANIEALPASQPIRGIIEGLTATALQLACAEWEPSRKMYLLAAPGIQAQSSGGAGPGQTLNDGILAFAEMTAVGPLWDVWLGHYPSAMCRAWASSHTQEVWHGTYWGNLRKLDFSNATDISGGGFTYTGTFTSTSTGQNLEDTAATFPNRTPGGDQTFIGEWVWVISGTGAGQMRKIDDSAATVLVLSTAWTTNPTVGAAYRIGYLYWHFETGDLVFVDAASLKSAVSVRIFVDRGLASANSIDLATDNGTVNDTTTVLAYASGTVSTADEPNPLFIGARSGRVVRYRFLGMVGDAASRLTRALLSVLTYGRPGGH